MINQTEAQERAHLKTTRRRLDAALTRIDARLREYAEDVQAQKTYLWENRADMDHAEKNSTRESVYQSVFTGEAALATRKRLQKLVHSPYFGRLDFAEQADTTALAGTNAAAQAKATPAQPIYIGIHAFFDDELKQNLIYDWRAPIASLFYDYEIGPARYEAPVGEVAGTIEAKRQYRIRNGQMEFMLDTAVNIVDEVLQKELSQRSDQRMQTIVATIQRDQNAIIRNAESSVLVIQGVAGSGKTSIALHRVAYLLYRFKDSLSSDDILIISPNRVFADYIANVLPELGEERIAELEMERLAEELLEHRYKFQTFFEQAALLAEQQDEALSERIRVKGSASFLRDLDAYVAQVEKQQFQPRDIWLGRRLVPDWFLAEIFAKQARLPLKERLKRIAQGIEQKVGIHYNHDVTPEERAQIKAELAAMTEQATLRNRYKGLFDWLGRPELFQPAKGGRLEYADVFPLIYLKMRLEGVSNPYRRIKHLLVDEMQDYSPVQYAVLARLFKCPKTILGDVAQTVIADGASSAERIKEVLPEAFCTKLCKSYRSTWEITQFAQRILPNPELIAIERHGEVPQVLGVKTRAAQTKQIRALIDDFRAAEQRTLGILCKTQKQANQLHRTLSKDDEAIHLLTASSAAFRQGVVICTAHTAKGLEFDQVIVPNADDANFASPTDRHLLYIACTRAMHRLTLIHVGEVTRFLQPEDAADHRADATAVVASQASQATAVAANPTADES